MNKDFRLRRTFIRWYYLLFCHGYIQEVCRACGGTGAHPGTNLTCAVCDGSTIETYKPEEDVFRN